MDKDIRTLLANTTLAARWLLEEEFARQLEGTFDIFPDGRINPTPSATLNAEQRFIRVKLVASIEHHRAKGDSAVESVYAAMRECSFTFSLCENEPVRTQSKAIARDFVAGFSGCLRLLIRVWLFPIPAILIDTLLVRKRIQRTIAFSPFLTWRPRLCQPLYMLSGPGLIRISSGMRSLPMS